MCVREKGASLHKQKRIQNHPARIERQRETDRDRDREGGRERERER